MKYLYIPEPQNDFIFAVVVEELGLVGALMILLIFALLVWRGITLSLRAKDKFGKLLGIGLTSQIGIQVVLNILVITDWLPNTGISLPFSATAAVRLLCCLPRWDLCFQFPERQISKDNNLKIVFSCMSFAEFSKER